MQKKIRHLGLALLGATACGMVAAQDLACYSELHFGQEGMLRMAVRMHFAQGQPSTIELSHLTLVYPTKTGYQCDARFVRGEASTTWIEEGKTSIVTLNGETPEESSRLVIERNPRGYRLDTRALSTAECGVRAQWPESVLLPLAGKRCTTRYE